MSLIELETNSRRFLTDGGLETTMTFENGFDLPHFASFTLLDSPEGRDALTTYFDRYIDIAEKSAAGFVLDTLTWRANKSWGLEMGMSDEQIIATNEACVAFARTIRDRRASASLPILINGIIGPASDGYVVGDAITVAQAQAVHGLQIQTLGRAKADLISALTITTAAEGAGIAKAAQEIDLPVVISFTVETDGQLPSGESLALAIELVDGATDAYPLYYMINCAHPDHFRDAVAMGESWTSRIGGLRANASRMSHAELDNAEELDAGDPSELGQLHSELLTLLPNVRVLGGCCGTDHRHVDAISNASTDRAA
ncbi:MAG: homocysteine S-methyltransferase family protein [Stappiaceae bacterium]